MFFCLHRADLRRRYYLFQDRALKIIISFEVFDEYLKISLSGGNPYKEIDEILKTIKTLMDENNRKRVLIEAIDIIIPSEMEKFYIGEAGVGVLGGKVKMALVTKQEYINKFFENVVVNRGGQLFVAGSEQEALHWLLQ